MTAPAASEASPGPDAAAASPATPSGRETSHPKGLLWVDKPEGPTSHDAVRIARRSLGERRIGHTGTLDPFATGLLILLVGPATRLADAFAHLPKRYLATVKLGQETDTCDHTGEVVRHEAGAETIERHQVQTAVTAHTGRLQQVPPQYSAKKVGGESAHRRVRRGEDVTLPPSEVIVHSMTVTEYTPPLVGLDIRCSTGTYIRSIARDMGRALGVGGHLVELRRTEIGPYTVADALQWSALAEPASAKEALVSTAEGVRHLRRFELSDADARLIRDGRSVTPGRLMGPSEPESPALGEHVLALHEAAVLSLGEIRDGQFRPKKVFPDGA